MHVAYSGALADGSTIPSSILARASEGLTKTPELAGMMLRLWLWKRDARRPDTLAAAGRCRAAVHRPIMGLVSQRLLSEANRTFTEAPPRPRCSPPRPAANRHRCTFRGLDFSYGSCATGSSDQHFQPCPLCHQKRRPAVKLRSVAKGQKANICAGQLTAGFGNRQLLPAHSVEPCQVLLRARTP